MSIREGQDAHAAGYADNLYLDPATRTNVEEASGANIIFITKDGKFVTPKSDTILPSVTRRSLMVVAEKYLWAWKWNTGPFRLKRSPSLQSVVCAGLLR